MRGKRIVLAFAVVIASALVLQAALGIRILVRETTFTPGGGRPVIVEGAGDLEAIGQPALVCRYFTGLGVRTIVLFGYDAADPDLIEESCPVIDR